MKIDQSLCIACLECIFYCPVRAIKEGPTKGDIFIDEDECVECGCCLRADVCTSEAIWQPELEWPRSIRADFSDVARGHPSTRVRGRGTSEMKTNDVTGRYTRDIIGVGIELGRPGTGASLRDLEKVTMAMLALGVTFEKENPAYLLIDDTVTGKFKKEVLKERVLSAVLEFATTLDNLPLVLRTVKELSQQVDTVFSVDMCSLLDPDGTCPAEEVARSAGFEIRTNGKNNNGLGRPLAKLREV